MSKSFVFLNYILSREDELNLTAQPDMLLEFRAAVERAIRGVKTIPRDTTSAWVYMEGDVVSMGYIAAYDPRYNAKERKDHYVVCSDYINNDKYARYSAQFYMKSSTNIDVAVRNAKKYLRTYQPEHLARILHGPLRQGISTVEHQFHREQAEASTKLFGTTFRQRVPRVASELRLLLNTGYEFADKTIEADLREYFAAVDEAETKVASKAAFVSVTERMGKQRYTVVELQDPTQSNLADTPPQHYDDTNIPEDIAGKLALLNMSTEDDFIQGVGIKVNERAYYVAW